MYFLSSDLAKIGLPNLRKTPDSKAKNVVQFPYPVSNKANGTRIHNASCGPFINGQSSGPDAYYCLGSFASARLYS